MHLYLKIYLKVFRTKGIFKINWYFLIAVYENRINDVQNFIQDVNKKYEKKDISTHDIDYQTIIFLNGWTPLMLGKTFL